jgi:hypothetical protein
MSVPQKRKKAEVITATQTWLHIYSIIVDSIKDQVPVHVAHTIAASAANSILKEVDLGD